MTRLLLSLSLSLSFTLSLSLPPLLLLSLHHGRFMESASVDEPSF